LEPDDAGSKAEEQASQPVGGKQNQSGELKAHDDGHIELAPTSCTNEG